MPQFRIGAAERERQKAAELAPPIVAAMGRKRWVAPVADGDIPVVKASVVRAQVNQGAAA